jgi:hypothetical protein
MSAVMERPVCAPAPRPPNRPSRSLGLPVKLHFAIVTKAKKPVVQLLPVPNNPDRVAAMKDNVADLWRAIQVGNFCPSPSPMNGATCAFRSRCPVFRK